MGVTLQGTITYPTLRKRNTSSKMPWEKESPAPGDRHCCLKDFGRSTRHDVWRPCIFIHSGKLILVLHLRRWNIGLEFISYHAPFNFWFKTLNYGLVRVESFLGTVKIGIWCQHYPVSISFWDILGNHKVIKNNGRHTGNARKKMWIPIKCYSYSFSLRNDPLPAEGPTS